MELRVQTGASGPDEDDGNDEDKDEELSTKITDEDYDKDMRCNEDGTSARVFPRSNSRG